MFVLLTACAPESPVIVPTGGASEASTPAATAQSTTDSTTESAPSVVVTEECTRGDTFDELKSGGQVRQYLLHVPAAYQAGIPAALVLVFHGAGIGARRFVDYSRFSSVTDREGFPVVYAQGLGEMPVWDPSPGSRDVQFTKDSIDDLQRRCNVDPARIYAAGHSNGGGMVHRLGCDLADRIAAIGPVSGAHSASASCSPSRPVPVFAIHGTADPVVPYESIPEWASAWAERNGCNPEPVDVPHNVLISERQWKNCRAGADVIQYTIVDLEHDWPSDLIDVGQTVWDFFEQHPLN